MKVVLLCAALTLCGCRGPKTTQEIQKESHDLYAQSMSKIDTGSRGRAHRFDIVGFCEYCGKDQEACATCEACQVASKR